MKLSRFDKLGSVFSDSLSSVKDLEKRGFSVSNVGLSDSPFGKSCLFNGTDSVIDTGSDWLPLGDLTVSVWIKPYSLGKNGYGRIIENGPSVLRLNPSFGLNYYGNAGVESSAITGNNVIELNAWQHIVITRASNGITNFYINTIRSGDTTTSGTPTAGTNNVLIGNSLNQTAAFDGLISNLIVFNKVLSKDEIISLYKNQVFDYEKNVIADYDMSSVNPVNNSFRSSGVNSVGSNVVVKKDWITGLEFNGVNSIVDTGSDWLPLGDITFSAWIKPYSFGGSSIGIIIADTSSYFYVNGTSSSSSIGFQTVGNIPTYSTNVINLNQWQHVLATRNSLGIVNFYVNGELSGIPNKVSGTPVAGTTNVIIGNNTVGNRAFSGVISKLKVFDCVLNGLQVKDLYNKELGGRR